jgi:hypothetical protein
VVFKSSHEFHFRHRKSSVTDRRSVAAAEEPRLMHAPAKPLSGAAAVDAIPGRQFNKFNVIKPAGRRRMNI